MSRLHVLAKECTVRLVPLVRLDTWPFHKFLFSLRLHMDTRSDRANLKWFQLQSCSFDMWPILYRTFDTRNRMYIFTSCFVSRITVMGPITTFIYIFTIRTRFLITINTFEIFATFPIAFAMFRNQKTIYSISILNLRAFIFYTSTTFWFVIGPAGVSLFTWTKISSFSGLNGENLTDRQWYNENFLK